MKKVIIASLAMLCIVACNDVASVNILVDSRDGKKYKTLKIGEQVWMAENLNYDAEGGKCYDNNPENCEQYGRLYDWDVAKKACPSGWHLPSEKEWKTLVNFAGGEKRAGKKLKTKSGWNGNGNGTNNYGFSALPGGSYLLEDAIFDGVGLDGDWWSFSGSVCLIGYSHDGILVTFIGNGLFSVRCVQD